MLMCLTCTDREIILYIITALHFSVLYMRTEALIHRKHSGYNNSASLSCIQIHHYIIHTLTRNVLEMDCVDVKMQFLWKCFHSPVRTISSGVSSGVALTKAETQDINQTVTHDGSSSPLRPAGGKLTVTWLQQNTQQANSETFLQVVFDAQNLSSEAASAPRLWFWDKTGGDKPETHTSFGEKFHSRVEIRRQERPRAFY